MTVSKVIRIDNNYISRLRFADDIVLLTKTAIDLQDTMLTAIDLQDTMLTG